MERFSDPATRLRTDLGTIVSGTIASGLGPRAHHVVVDEISGRFARVSEHVWKRLNRNDADPSMWQEAAAAGWMRERVKSAKSRFSILAVRIPLGSIDRFATWMAPRTDWLFSAQAILLWSIFACVALLAFLSSYEQLSVAVYSLPTFLKQVNPIGLAGVFVCTKLVHELAHAIVCRRIGARCGEVGILVMCGMPCPYCDVTDVWRVTRAASRCAVMLAGIYVELVIASVSLFGWVLSHDPAWQLFFVYVMLVCGASTLLFNANPLMRYDGYYVLSDLVGTTNLRTQSRTAWMRLVVRVIGGPGDGRTWSQGRRGYALAFYHVAASTYRCLVALAIASLVIHWASYVSLRPVAVVLVVLAIASSCMQITRRLFGVVRGEGSWSEFPQWRRMVSVATLMVFIVCLVMVPFPRFRRVTGRIEASDAVVVYVSNGGIVDSVDAEVGSVVQDQQRLATIRNPEVELERLRLEGKLRLASFRLETSGRLAFERREDFGQSEVFRAAEASAIASFDYARSKEEQNKIVATKGGMVLPPEPLPTRQVPPADDPGGEPDLKHANTVERLAALDGMGVENGDVWCRISPTRARRMVFLLNGEDFRYVSLADRVNVHESVGLSDVYSTEIASISPVVRDADSVTDEAWFQAMCPLAEVDDASFLHSMGSSCEVVIRLANRSLAQDCLQWITVWLRG